MVLKRGQVTIFVIIAIVLVVAVLSFFLLKDKVGKENLPPFVEPVEITLLSCLEERTSEGISLLEINGGSLYDDDFEAGSRYIPFSSHLNFMGNEIPYWFYLSGNNFIKENIPSIKDMEADLERYIENGIMECDLGAYYDEGYVFSRGLPSAKVNIHDRSLDVDLDFDMAVTKSQNRYVLEKHSVEVNSKLGELYNDASELYKYEQDELFLEKYAIDFLRLYAPVDGVELTCSPKVWNAPEVFSDLREATELNTLALRSSGKSDEYFALELPISNEVRFINSKEWASAFEVSPNQGSSLIAKPVGNQEGLGILGFCYVPYHFVYDYSYPVLVQVYDEKTQEIFQFPVVVIIKGNKEREALKGVSPDGPGDPEICQYANTPVNIHVQDSKSRPIQADISFSCFASNCYYGETGESNGSLSTMFPQCVNGKIIARAPGFAETSFTYSSVHSGSALISMKKEFEKEVSFKLDGKTSSRNAIISFLTESGESQTIVYPENKKVVLSEGTYYVEVYVYGESSLTFEGTTREECVDVPTTFGGMFGITKEECFELDVPEQLVSTVLVGGGSSLATFSEDQLNSGGSIEIRAEGLPVPKTIEEVQNNYILFEDKELGVRIK